MEGRDFIALATSPLVAVVTDTARISINMLQKKNNIPDMVQYLRPFGHARHSHAPIQDMHGATIQLDPGHVRFVDLYSLSSSSTNISTDTAVLESILSSSMASALSTPVDASPHSQPSPSSSHPAKLPCLRTVQEAQQYRESVQLESITPWFQQYLRIISKHMGVSEHETFNHPVACLVVVSTSDPDPVATAKGLLSDANLPPILKKPYMDPYIQRLYLLVHDPEEAPNIDPNVVLANMKRAFPTHLLTINTRPISVDTLPVVPDIWSASIAETAELLQKLSSPLPSQQNTLISPILNDQEPPPLSGLKSTSIPSLENLSITNMACGRRISISDYSSVNTFIEGFLFENIINRMVALMKDWERDVASARRGISGRLYKVGLKYFSGSKSATAQPAPFIDYGTGKTIFPFLSPEMIMRRLADYAFILRDYKYALSVYDSVKKDFSTNERYAKYFAGIQEMIAVTSLMITESPKSSIDILADNAVQSYNDAKCPLYANRAIMWIVEMTKEHHLYRDAASLLIRMTGEESDLKGALFLEQAAVCFLRTTPPMPRKYIFHLILAGNRFSKCGLRGHAQRNYATALETYDGLQWSLVDDHIHFALGRHSFHLGQTKAAMQYFIKLLRKSRQSAAGQRAYLAEFLYIYQQFEAERIAAAKAGGDVGGGKTAAVQDDALPTIPLPLIVDAGIKLTLQRSEVYQGDGISTLRVASSPFGAGYEAPASHEGIKDDVSVWVQLEEKVLKVVNDGVSGTLESASRRRPPHGHAPTAKVASTLSRHTQTTTAVGEPVIVCFQWMNPLQVPIPVNNLFLECSFDGNAETVTELNIPPDGDVPALIEMPEFDVQVLHDVSLDASERRKIQLKIYPKKEGEIVVLGIRYLLCGVIPTFRRFQKRGRRLNDTLAQQQDTNGVYAEDVSLRITVTPPMPVLDIVFHSFPESMLLGQVSQVALELNNRGTRGLKNLYVITSHAPVFCFGDGTALDLPTYAPFVQSDLSSFEETMNIPNTLVDRSVTALQLPLPDRDVMDLSSPGTKESLSRGILPASLTTLVPVWIRADKAGKHTFRLLFVYQSEDQGSYRTLRCTLTTEIFPALRVNIFTRASITTLNEFILGVEMENMNPVLPLVFRQITSISPSWQIEPLIASEDRCEVTLQPSQTQYQYYRIKRWTGRMPLVVHQTPELLTTAAIQRLILQEDALPFTPDDITMQIRSLGSPNQISYVKEFPLDSLLQTQRYLSRIAFLISHHMDAKALAGRALFSATVRERKALVTSLLKPRLKDTCPVRVIVECASEATLDANGEVHVTLGNTSWMHVAEYNFDATLALRCGSLTSGDEADMDIAAIANKRGSLVSERASATSRSAKSANDTTPLEVVPNNASTISSKSNGTTFSWIGPTHFHGTLAPESSTRFTLHACFTTPGMHDVNQWRLNTTLFFSDAAKVADGNSSPSERRSPDGNGTPAQVSELRTLATAKNPGLAFVQIPTMAQLVYVSDLVAQGS
ncbi:hypothetical protein BSLG_000856 [Batrachochytrium salamandrivorans]|nr:hypothetical protein BSLG_000856 [Batrachochytrium salamandrivorans]